MTQGARRGLAAVVTIALALVAAAALLTTSDRLDTSDKAIALSLLVGLVSVVPSLIVGGGTGCRCWFSRLLRR